MIVIIINGKAKYDQCILVRKAYPCSHFEMANQAMGAATRNDTMMSTANSLYNNFKIPGTDAPSTFRIPISFVLCNVVNDAKPNNPIHATKIASVVNSPNVWPKR